MSNNFEQVRKSVWLLKALSGFGAQQFKIFCENVKDISDILCKDARMDFYGKGYFTKEQISELETLISGNEYEKDIDHCREAGVELISVFDSRYPKNLSAIYDPPLVIYVKGTILQEDEVGVGIVGTRHPSIYGLKCAGKFAFELAEKGVTIISGLARGIDGESHRGALRGKGRTIAVLGSGLDVIYPKGHENLYEQITESGAVISEYPLGTEPARYHFPMRNRIIAGLSIGVLVVEASQKSGALITANIAANENREVYVIPGQIDSIQSLGTNQLIQKGARLVTSANEILEDIKNPIQRALNQWKRESESPVPLPKVPGSNSIKSEPGTFGNGTGSNDPLLKLLSDEPLYFDEIMQLMGGKPAEVHTKLVKLELEGSVKRSFGGGYVKLAK
ncbi:MAG: DNA protecting protein DprA [Omnitrophica bacterium RIFCSPLOWO2_12_FULL_44_17]|uniref:DNA protecting protein DprA n=1 Tax=Candidatus Danuiimicrobium aquiferis TaxID=1801832 RepID=A0A1G1L217_9BACT|nr:MAG: DNA protecting protein DprA [Omnitrophica bacterium RIFCSPHIGHO2_02_FULL_45_28]OGW88785.1 MAG: DNA protecting protein DprA [Omnitrophica bacterium RIFCSPHIGHO2_12_FULL_44_12]OGW99158.1 MAG: DNA protecting protein DprA [Omnitrophica bacterium RIFCSPLOWO2_12_FULL_44_17]OGX04425.1 MAG: DNA protecting protein DprA [Omnitrophica bacterium RIFCSPLOWO2_02_FULL_44_11]